MPSPTTWAQLYLYPLLTILFLWGILTLGLLWLNQRKPHVGRVVLVVMLGVLAFSHQQLWEVRSDMSIWGIYRAFIASMLIWAWHELAFYSGMLAGPWRQPCPPEARGWRRFGYAISTHLYHMLAVGGDVVVLFWLHHGAANQIGLWVFVLLWLLQLSAKLNVLLGVRNLQIHFFPHHMRYLGSFWNERPHNLFFWPSLGVLTILAGLFWFRATEQAPGSNTVAMSLLAGLMTLGVLEHIILVLPHSQNQRNVMSNQQVIASDKTE